MQTMAESLQHEFISICLCSYLPVPDRLFLPLAVNQFFFSDAAPIPD